MHSIFLNNALVQFKLNTLIKKQHITSFSKLVQKDDVQVFSSAFFSLMNVPERRCSFGMICFNTILEGNEFPSKAIQCCVDLEHCIGEKKTLAKHVAQLKESFPWTNSMTDDAKVFFVFQDSGKSGWKKHIEYLKEFKAFFR